MNEPAKSKLPTRSWKQFPIPVSHDLRAPLRSIHGYMNIFHEEYSDKFDDEARRLINIIVKNAKKWAAHDDLLPFSRWEKRSWRTDYFYEDMVRHCWEEQEHWQDDRPH